jgi:intracellular sulfur oxidation DsrE/DsrF family protein
MLTVAAMIQRFATVFEEEQATVLAQTITDAYGDLVKTGDFNELKAIVRNLAEAQQRTEIKVGALAEAQDRLAEAQQRTEVRMTELAEAQQRTEVRMTELAAAQQRTEVRMTELAAAQQHTEVRMTELAEAQQRTEANLASLARTVEGLAQELGGLSRSMSYSLENEAYRALPALLQSRYGIELQDRLIRTEIGGREINLFARGQRNGESVYIVGETKLQLDERRSNRRAVDRIFDQLQEQVQAVQQVYPEVQIVPILLTHYARPAFLQQADARGVIVIQSFEW